VVGGSAVVGHGDLGSDDQVPVDGDIYVLPVVVELFGQFHVLQPVLEHAPRTSEPVPGTGDPPGSPTR